MTAFWSVNLIVWALVAIMAAPGAWTAFRARDGRVRRGDPMRLATFLVALLFCGQVIRWLFFADNISLWKALYVTGALTGMYIARLLWAYGRGLHV